MNISLEKPYEGLYVSNDMWREMFDFSTDAVLMVLASELVKLILKYYDKLSEKYRKMIPLKMVYIPVAKEDAE